MAIPLCAHPQRAICEGLYRREVWFPKGNKGANALQIDAAIFDHADWIERYQAYWRDRRSEDLHWLGEHLLAVVEFKRDEREIEQVFTQQIKPAMREKEPSDANVLGMFYDEGRLLLFHRRNGRYLRYDETLNQKGEDSQVSDLSLQYQDAYSFIPSFQDLRKLINRPALVDRSKRSITDLDIIRTISSPQIKEALSRVLRTLDKANLVNQRGYHVLIETLALKIFDEKRNESNPKKKLEFDVTDQEAAFSSLTEKSAREFVARMKGVREAAEAKSEDSRRRSDCMEYKSLSGPWLQSAQHFKITRSPAQKRATCISLSFTILRTRSSVTSPPQFLTRFRLSISSYRSSILATARLYSIRAAALPIFCPCRLCIGKSAKTARSSTMPISTASILTRTWSSSPR